MATSLQNRGIWEDLKPAARQKLTALPSDLAQPTLGLSYGILSEIKGQMTALYHCAWKVNFNQKLESFEKDSIQGLKNLLDICLSCYAPGPPRVCFCSSIGTVLRTSVLIIAEELPERFEDAQPTGYAQSKLVGEHICTHVATLTGLPVYVVRIGQIIGDTERGIWNHLEAIPLLMQTARTLGALPAIDEELRWLPVDVAARCLIEITSSSANTGTFNLVNRHTIHWTRDILTMLRDAGMEFEVLDPPAWVERLRKSEQDPAKNPPIKLLEYFVRQYDTIRPRRQCDFIVEKAGLASSTFREVKAPDSELIRKIVAYFQANHW